MHKRRFALIGATFLLLFGCNQKDASRSLRDTRTSTNSNVRIDDAISTLNTLHQFVNAELEPAAVVIDADRTFDRQDVMAVFGPNPAVEGQPFSNYFKIVSRNVDLRRQGVQPGDTVHYFAALDEVSEGLGIAAYVAVEMTVAQVISESELLVEEAWAASQLDEPRTLQIWRNVDDRMLDISEQLGTYAAYGDPPLGWQLAPDDAALKQAVSRINQWMRHRHTPEDRPLPQLAESLPKELLESPRLSTYVSPQALGAISFADHEGRLLQEAVWLRDIAAWAGRDELDQVKLARELFDWTVRNIQIESPDNFNRTMRPWDVLLYGRGTAAHRAWVFALLCRQQALQAAILTLPTVVGDDAQRDLWAVGVVAEDEIVLFDPYLGLPLPGAEPGSIATLEALTQNPERLRRLDINDDQTYRITAKQLENVVAELVTSPLSLSHRADLLQEQLAGKNSFAVAMDVEEAAAQFTGKAGIGGVRLWAYPYQTIDAKLLMAVRAGSRAKTNQNLRVRAVRDFRVFALEPRLWQGRVLHFRGLYASDRGGEDSEQESIEGHSEALVSYQQARASSRDIEKETSPQIKPVMIRAKEDATYWLGLLKHDLGDYQAAIQSWFSQVLAQEPASRWAQGAKYNLARAYEALGEYDRAIELLQESESPQRHGDLLRARMLEEQANAAENKAETP